MVRTISACSRPASSRNRPKSSTATRSARTWAIACCTSAWAWRISSCWRELRQRRLRVLRVVDDALDVLGQVFELVLPALELADLGLAFRQALNGMGHIRAHALGIVVQAGEGVAVDALLAQLRDILLQFALQALHLVLPRLDRFERRGAGERLGQDAAHFRLRPVELLLPAA